MMLRSFRDEWSAALRSGEFPQTRGTLHRLKPFDGEPDDPQPGFCCIGVRCELDLRKGLMHKTIPVEGVAALYGEPEQDQEEYMGSQPAWDTAKRWGLTDQENPDPNNPNNDFLNQMIVYNDRDRWTFAQIADWLDAQPVQEDPA